MTKEQKLKRIEDLLETFQNELIKIFPATEKDIYAAEGFKNMRVAFWWFIDAIQNQSDIIKPGG